MKPGTKERTRVEVRNFFNQEQLDEFAELLRSLPISVTDKQIVARSFADKFEVKEKERLVAGVV